MVIDRNVARLRRGRRNGCHPLIYANPVIGVKIFAFIEATVAVEQVDFHAELPSFIRYRFSDKEGVNMEAGCIKKVSRMETSGGDQGAECSEGQGGCHGTVLL
jgi:hypothetical protein